MKTWSRRSLFKLSAAAAVAPVIAPLLPAPAPMFRGLELVSDPTLKVMDEGDGVTSIWVISWGASTVEGIYPR